MIARKSNKQDTNFILNSWLKSYRSSADTRGVPNTIYFMEQHRLILEILDRSECLVLCDPADHNILYGYLVYEHIESVPTIHWLYVKHTFRGLGLSKILVNESGISIVDTIIFSHNTAAGNAMSLGKPGLIYNPYILRKVTKGDVNAHNTSTSTSVNSTGQ